ncbi:hypothetical protein [Tenacibaculum maritimum]|uniref:hypothetical protein n=3 Tax=Tenacibaculum maritimum TaxID=107401 RepID=UPI0012E5255E|nr:hypothetical protein [Tenacibaculum maritimum]CAA0159846.1 conserved hypothetical protein [Tenacibaculum maritimum]CAA0216533.1 conserved hypothetical protein [Tenacibaculum maritimum]CAA0244199.1 conserved hypothetical protein [Tenacibaculum maritimum]
MRKLITSLLLTIVTNGYSQFKKGEGAAIRFSKEVIATYKIYETPLLINQVGSQKEIDYSTYEGLIQSFFSASNRKWALSEYLDGRTKIVRDEEHFEAVKKNDTSKNYIQIETVYEYNYNGRNMAFVKYSFIMDKIPFPIIGGISIEKVKDRWYISDLLNQEYMISIFSNFEPIVLLELLKGKSKDNFIKELIKNTRAENKGLDFEKLANIFRGWYKTKNKESIYKVKDKRLIIEGYNSPKAQLNQMPNTFKIKAEQAFILEKSFFSEYLSSENKLVSNKKTKEKYKGKPEFNLIDDDLTVLISKFTFEDDNNTYSIIKYSRNNSFRAIVYKKEVNDYVVINNKFVNWVVLFKKIKPQLFYDLYEDNKLIGLKKEVLDKNKVLDLDKLAKVIKEHRTTLAKYLDD